MEWFLLRIMNTGYWQQIKLHFNKITQGINMICLHSTCFGSSKENREKVNFRI